MSSIKSKLTANDRIYFFRMFRFMLPPGRAIMYAITQLIYSGQGFALPFFFSIFIGNIMHAIVNGYRDALIPAGINLAVLLFSYMFLLLVGVYFNVMTQVRAGLDMKQLLFRTFVKTGLEDAKHSGEGIASINTESDTALSLFEDPILMFTMCIMTIAGSIGVIFAMEWRIGLASLGVGILSFFMQKRFTKPLAEVGKRRMEVNAEAVKSTSNIFSGAMAIRAYNMQPQAFLTFDKENRRLRKLDIKQGFITMGQNIFATIEGWLTLLVVFGFGGWLAATGVIEFHTVAAIFVMSSTFTSNIGHLGTTIANLQPPIAGAKRVFAVLDQGAENTKKYGVTRNVKGYAINIKNFNFKYRDGETDTLKNITLNIPENKMVALVGASGSGKSTLLRAILGMYDRDDMSISLGDLHFNESSLHGWRRNFAYVDQSCKLFDMTVKENIAMGVGGEACDEDVTLAAKRASAHEFIAEMENGYDTPCGEKGDTLSGGQKQRIAIARALVRKAPVLLFDEATSALDKDSERHIMDTIEGLRDSHTILYTTHNMDNVKTADIVVVMDAGNVAEVGTHEELLRQNGIYSKLVAGMA